MEYGGRKAWRDGEEEWAAEAGVWAEEAVWDRENTASRDMLSYKRILIFSRE